MTKPPDNPGLLDKHLLVQAALRDRRLGTSKTPVAVLECLIDHDGPSGCFPGKKRISNLCNVSVDAVEAALKLLKKFDYIDWRQRYDKETRIFDTNVYTIHYPPSGKRHHPTERQLLETIDTFADLVRDRFPNHSPRSDDIAEFVAESLRVSGNITNVGHAVWKEVRKAEDAKGGKEHLTWWLHEYKKSLES
jgi:hypothetical protein